MANFSNLTVVSFKLICIISILFPITCIHSQECHSKANTEEVCPIGEAVPKKYLLYDVNPPEGFNLRRDVYMRLAVFIKNLPQDKIKWHLVLPPWSHLPHWRSAEIGSQSKLPWDLFFDVSSLKSFAPVVEMYEFLEDYGKEAIDHVLILQHFKEISFGNYSWEDKWAVEQCQRPVKLIAKDSRFYKWPVLGYDMPVKKIQCVSFHGPASLLENLLNNFSGRFIVLEHAEVVLHDFYGGKDYWNCRKSMQFNENLKQIASDFMQTQLNSSFTLEGTSSKNKYLKGNPYLCAHLRRKDFAVSRPKDVPNLKWASVQIEEKLKKYNLSTAFLISDEMNEDVAEVFRSLLPSFRVVTFHPSYTIKQTYKDGGIAIIEQIICSYARYFIGTYESTFSFRIQEERELLHMDPDTTFNRFCGDNQSSCKQPTRWLKDKYYV
ncbi:GDP-fucose protein O-fucosyltransferase 2 [Planococcus citri]|uniref:GDP-fucose protein O-fucosyltransferase 2 n=1 Tax=Planococcus citri TaxID=170843 RepID=UPI0031F9FE65